MSKIFNTQYFDGKPKGWFAFCQRTALGGPIRKHRTHARLDGFRISIGPTFASQRDWRKRKFFGRPWQDLIFATGEIVFLASLFPVLADDNAHVPAFTGLATALMLYTFMAAHVSYRNWITVALSFVTATLWVFIGLGFHV